MKNDKEMSKDRKRSLIERLNSGPVICAEGFLFEIEKEDTWHLENLFLWFH